MRYFLGRECVMMSQDYALMIYRSIYHFWWDVVVRGNSVWMNEHNGYMFLSVYAATVACVAASLRRGDY